MLTLWLDSYTIGLTPEGCQNVLVGLKHAETNVFFYKLDKKAYPMQKRYAKPGFKFCFSGKRWSVPKNKLTDLWSKCEQVVKGGQAEFKLGVRVIQVTNVTITQMEEAGE